MKLSRSVAQFTKVIDIFIARLQIRLHVKSVDTSSRLM